MSEQPISPLVAQIMSKNAADLARTTNAVIDSLTADRDRLRAELETVRNDVTALLSARWMPTSRAIIDALYPSAERIAAVVPGRSEP